MQTWRVFAEPVTYIIDHDNGLEYDDDMASSSFSTSLTDSFEISQRSEGTLLHT